MNASALNTNLILLNSKSKRFPNGLGNDSGVLGKYIAFHNYRASVSGTIWMVTWINIIWPQPYRPDTGKLPQPA
jgi:hypothetical protein